ncbi:MAG: amidoligase family protein, partial [Pseudomonadales bacterium]|nr:amidoligase family protein [Pseudomonadales bacterium]
ALRYAFGVHLNPELPALDAGTIVNYLRAYFVLYDWIAGQERVDTARKITPYIDHFEKSYIKLVIDPGYAPSVEALIDDYIEHNPTRNRSLDMLPLFAHLDEPRVRAAIDDDRIKARPTFHYRLPNCDIDSPDWNIDLPWSLWLEVEKLACDKARLGEYCQLFAQALERLTHNLDGQWPAKVGKLIDEE